MLACCPFWFSLCSRFDDLSALLSARAFSLTVVFVSLLAAVIPRLAQAEPASSVAWSATDDQPILTFTRSYTLLAENDPVPELRIYGDGRVLVHVPAYKPGAGDYTRWLSGTELQALLRAALSDGTMALSGDLRRLGAMPDLSYRSEHTDSALTVRLTEWVSATGERRLFSQPLVIRARNVGQRDTLAAAPRGYGALLATETQLFDLMERVQRNPMTQPPRAK